MGGSVGVRRVVHCLVKSHMRTPCLKEALVLLDNAVWELVFYHSALSDEVALVRMPLVAIFIIHKFRTYKMIPNADSFSFAIERVIRCIQPARCLTL